MNKCLVTKLNGSSNNSELLRLGEMRIKILKVQNPTEYTQGFSLGFNKPVTLEIVSDGYFTDKTLTENKGKSITLNAGINSIWVNGTHDVEIAILDKYSLTNIFCYYQGAPAGMHANNLEFNISYLKYSTAMTSLELFETKVSGDIGDLKALTALKILNLGDTQVSGDIGDLKALTALTYLNLSDTKVSGDIGDLKALTTLSILELSDTKVSGDIGGLKTLTALSRLISNRTQVSGDIGDLKALTTLSILELFETKVSGDIGDLKALTALTYLNLYNSQVPITGDIGALSVLSKCTYISINSAKLTGDIATVPAVCRFTSFYNDKGSVFTWGTRPSTAKIIAIGGQASITNIDKMLQNQAQCQTGFSPNDEPQFKTIQVAGNRTSASDAAVETLQQKGYTVSIAKA